MKPLHTKWEGVNVETPLSFLDGQEKLALTAKMGTTQAHAPSTCRVAGLVFKLVTRPNSQTGQ